MSIHQISRRTVHRRAYQVGRPFVREYIVPILLAVVLKCLGVPSAVRAQDIPTVGSAASTVTINLSAKSLNEACVAVSRAVTPMVVSITVPGKITNTRLQYYDDYLRHEGRRSRSEIHRSQSIGSGVIVTEDGYILTNHHVVEDVYEDSILVRTSNGDAYYADIVGVDPLSDLAVLRIYGKGFPVPHFGNSDGLNVGEWVLAVGNPLGLQSTVTAGIVSAIGRGDLTVDEDDRTIKNYIQTDAAINPGNSGGGLFNLEGDLVGINTAIFSRTGYFLGYGFAIPGNLAKSVAEDLIEDGVIDRGYLGISVGDVDDTTATKLRLGTVKGVVVDDVDPSSPAQVAGIKARDVIIRVDSVDITSFQDIQGYLALHRVGSSLSFVVLRDGGSVTVSATLARSVEKENQSAPVTVPGSFGIEVGAVTDDVAKRLGLASPKGVLIASVLPYSAAAHAGLLRDDILLRVDGRNIYSIEGYQKAMGSLKPGDSVTATVWRNGAEVALKAILQRR